MILILADSSDAHADEVEKHLQNKGVDFFRFNLDVSSLNNSYLDFNGKEWKLFSKGRYVDSTAINVVWSRRLTVNLDLDQEIYSGNINFQIWRAEWNRALYGLYSVLRNVYWINPIDKSNLMDNKFYQMRLATEFGFVHPDYITSNEKSSLVKFARTHGLVALKFMSQEMYKGDDGLVRGLYVNKITEVDIKDFEINGENPITLQQYVSKKFEVRHTAICGRHFACKILSQESSRSQVDWRRYDIANTPYEPIEAPPDVISNIDRFMAAAGIRYGAFDFIVDQADFWWYLEVNSNGQWLWIEDLAGLPISATIATALVEKEREFV